MGGRGSNSSKSKSRILKMNDKKLDKLIKETDERILVLAREKISTDNNPSIPFNEKEKAGKKYYQARSLFNNLWREKNRRLDKERTKRLKEQAAKPKPPHKFINGFGETTNRYITTATYERARRRREKEAREVFMGLR